MCDVSKCNKTKAFPADEARSSGLSRAEWVEGDRVASHLLDETREQSVLTQALSTCLLKGMDAIFFSTAKQDRDTNDVLTHSATADQGGG